jgi:CubicO group peptidase (beta-lactamase class C family)
VAAPDLAAVQQAPYAVDKYTMINVFWMSRLSRRQFVHGMAAGIGSSLVPLSLYAPAAALGARPYADGLSRQSPDEANVDARVVLDFIDSVFANGLDLHSFMLYRHGDVVAEGWSWPYASHRPHMMHSLTKSVTACGVGIAIDEGYFPLDDAVISFYDDELPAQIDEKLAAMTVRDLLTMQSGHAESVSGPVFRPLRTSWVAEFFKIPVVYAPGTYFLYSSAVTFMLSAIVTRTTGQSVRDFLQPRMFEPLGIGELQWDASPHGISSGGNGLSWTTVDSLKLGILHLNRGRWRGQQVLSESWVEQATRSQVPNGEYGFQWWIDAKADAYIAEGAFGQFAIVFPKHGAVLAITAGVPRESPFYGLIFEHFPAAFGDSDYVASSADVRQLAARCEDLCLLPDAVYQTSPVAQRISGQIYGIEPNDDGALSVQIEISEDQLDFRLSDHRGNHRVIVGLREWIESTTGITGNKLHHEYQSDDMRVVAHGRWRDEHTLEMTWQFVETAWVDHLVCRFFEDRISIDRRTNANYGPLVASTLRGKLRGERE